MGAIWEFFDSSRFLPHGSCILWRPDLIALHVASDTLTALAYYSIPVALVYFACKREDLEFRWMFVLFSIFILACGTTHLMGVWTLWYPDYALDGLIKLLTAVASVGTALILWRIMPTALAIPSKRQLAEVNRKLQTQVVERQLAEEKVRRLNRTLDLRVQERTQELERINATLQAEISERKGAEERNRLLVAELSHRVKNTLASCRSMVNASLRGNGDIGEAVKALDGRLQAMALAHDLLTEQQWRGADLKVVLECQLAAFSGGERVVRLAGPAVYLDAQAATALAMTLHELATNASKYGALSVPGGAVDLAWQVHQAQGEGARLELTWQERGGPPVETPQRQGFGTQLILGRIPYELGGKIDLEYAAAGLVCRIEIPVRDRREGERRTGMSLPDPEWIATVARR